MNIIISLTLSCLEKLFWVLLSLIILEDVRKVLVANLGLFTVLFLWLAVSPIIKKFLSIWFSLNTIIELKL